MGSMGHLCKAFISLLPPSQIPLRMLSYLPSGTQGSGP